MYTGKRLNLATVFPVEKAFAARTSTTKWNSSCFCVHDRLHRIYDRRYRTIHAINERALTPAKEPFLCDSEQLLCWTVNFCPRNIFVVDCLLQRCHGISINISFSRLRKSHRNNKLYDLLLLQCIDNSNYV